MHPAVAWKAQFLHRLQHRVVANCGSAGERLAAAGPLIEAPMHVAGVAAGAARANIRLALEALDLAHHHIHLAATNMLALERLGLGGGSRNPAAPLASIQELVAPNAAIGAALARLLVAYPHADSGCEYIDWCRGLLTVIHYLLDHPGLPNVDALIVNEQMNAATARKLAAGALQACTDEATTALQGMLGPGDRSRRLRSFA